MLVAHVHKRRNRLVLIVAHAHCQNDVLRSHFILSEHDKHFGTVDIHLWLGWKQLHSTVAVFLCLGVVVGLGSHTSQSVERVVVLRRHAQNGIKVGFSRSVIATLERQFRNHVDYIRI